MGVSSGAQYPGVLASPVLVPDPPKGLEEEYPLGNKGLERHPLSLGVGSQRGPFGASGCFLRAAGFS